MTGKIEIKDPLQDCSTAILSVTTLKNCAAKSLLYPNHLNLHPFGFKPGAKQYNIAPSWNFNFCVRPQNLKLHSHIQKTPISLVFWFVANFTSKLYMKLLSTIYTKPLNLVKQAENDNGNAKRSSKACSAAHSFSSSGECRNLPLATVKYTTFRVVVRTMGIMKVICLYSRTEATTKTIAFSIIY